MTHTETLGLLKQDLDDLKVRNPKKYDELERRLRRIELESNFYVSQSPAGVRAMERAR